MSVDQLENYLQFKRWYWTNDTEDIGYRYNYYAEGTESDYYGRPSGLGFEVLRRRQENAERDFLKVIDEYWRINTPDINGNPDGSIDDWWWFANNYIWANFPPVYWAYADLLNSAQIKYTPLFY